MPFFSVPCSRRAGGMGLCSGSIPSQARASLAGQSPVAAPALPKMPGRCMCAASMCAGFQGNRSLYMCVA